MFELIEGPIFEHKQTKKLLHYLPKESIVFLWHEDLDGVAVDGLIQAKVKAVINGMTSMTGLYTQHHVKALLDADIAVYDVQTSFKRDFVFKGEEAFIYNNSLYVEQQNETIYAAELFAYDDQAIATRLNKAQQCYASQFNRFVHNTLDYAKRECKWFMDKPDVPSSLRQVKGKDVFIIARNTLYEKDLKAVRSSLKRKDVIVIAVDGAADGLIKLNIRPDYIIGDMDSISDKAIGCGATLVCHEHPSGTSPGKQRLSKMGLDVETIRFVGTSEDIAITVSYWAGAKHLYLIGCRIGMNEFLEKSRAGMGATLLSRIQAGDIITDLKGIHKLTEPSRNVANLISNKDSIFSWVVTCQQYVAVKFSSWKKKEVLRHE